MHRKEPHRSASTFSVTTVFALMAAAAAVSAFFVPASEPPRRPNVVVILIDTLRADHLPVYGYAKDTAPFLTRLAAATGGTRTPPAQ